MKKLFLFSLMSVLALTAQAGNKVKFTITGKTTTKSQEITIANYATGKVVGTAAVKEGNFTYSGSEEADTYLVLVDKAGKKKNYVITDGPEIMLDMTKNMATGTPLNEELYSVSYQIGQLYKKEQYAEARAYMLEKIEANKDNCVPDFLILNNSDLLDYPKLKELMNSGAYYTKHPLKVYINKHLESLEKVQKLIGTQFKDFKIPDMRGVKHHISEFVGQKNYVFIDFWASWCKPCLSEIPNIKKNYELYHTKGFDVVGISLDSDKGKCIAAIGKYNLAWQNFCDYDGWNSVAATAYDVHSIPFNLLCDGDGKIVAVNLRGKALGIKLKEIYGE